MIEAGLNFEDHVLNAGCYTMALRTVTQSTWYGADTFVGDAITLIVCFVQVHCNSIIYNNASLEQNVNMYTYALCTEVTYVLRTETCSRGMTTRMQLVGNWTTN